MSITSFRDVWGLVRLHVPDAPVMLVRDWVQSTYAELTDYRPWTWTYESGQITWQDAIEVDCTVTLGSATVTSAGLFTSAMVGRQFRVGTFPIYTIATLVDANTITLNLAFQGTTEGAVTGQILDAYVVMPEHFGSFLAVVDQVNQRWIPWWGTQDELDLIDPTRTGAGTPLCMGFLDLSTQPTTNGHLRYQLSPIPLEAGSLQYYMRTRPASLQDATPFKGVLAHRGDVLQTGALAQAARWPGTRERPNPYFNLSLARQLSEDFERAKFQLDIRDDDQNSLSFDKVPWQRWTQWTWAVNTHYLQQTDATIGAYIGFSWYPGW